MEVSLHNHVAGPAGGHDNIIRFFRSDEDHVWRWIAMEYADGGDLFDKIGMRPIGCKSQVARNRLRAAEITPPYH